MSKVVIDRAFRASMPTQRWKQQPVRDPRRRPILLFLTRSSTLRWMWVKRFIFLPVMWDVAVMISSYSGFMARA